MAREYPGVYAYKTKQGTRYRYNFRDSDGKQSCKRGFLSPQAAAIDKAGVNVQAAAGTLHLSTARFEDYFESWLAGHKPFIDAGTWNDYRTHGDQAPDPRVRRQATRRDRHRRRARMACRELSGRDLQAQDAQQRARRARRLPQPGHQRPAAADQPRGSRQAPSARAHRARVPAHPRDRPLPVLLLDDVPAAGRTADQLWPADLRGARTDLGGHRPRHAARSPSIARPRVPAGRPARRRAGVRAPSRPDPTSSGPSPISRPAKASIRCAPQRRPVFTMPVRRKAQNGRWPSAGPPGVIDRNTVTRDWHKAALRDAGLRDMPLHALRHTAAATWLYCGQPLIYVQRALGHASITTTESFYGHLEQSLLKTVARDMEAAVRAAGRAAVIGDGLRLRPDGEPAPRSARWRTMRTAAVHRLHRASDAGSGLPQRRDRPNCARHPSAPQSRSALATPRSRRSFPYNQPMSSPRPR